MPAHKRNTVNDGFRNRLESLALNNFAPLWQVVEHVPWLRHRVNSLLINTAIYKTVTRPYPFTTLSP